MFFRVLLVSKYQTLKSISIKGNTNPNFYIVSFFYLLFIFLLDFLGKILLKISISLGRKLGDDK